MGYYTRHIFFCVNDRGAGFGPPQLQQVRIGGSRDYAKKEERRNWEFPGQGKIRVNQAGCLDRCEEGPVCVVYPEGTWYTYIDESDIDEIIESHLLNGKPVERLKI